MKTARESCGKTNVMISSHSRFIQAICGLYVFGPVAELL
jgi:hypothetical protein